MDSINRSQSSIQAQQAHAAQGSSGAQSAKQTFRYTLDTFMKLNPGLTSKIKYDKAAIETAVDDLNAAVESGDTDQIKKAQGNLNEATNNYNRDLSQAQVIYNHQQSLARMLTSTISSVKHMMDVMKQHHF